MWIRLILYAKIINRFTCLPESGWMSYSDSNFPLQSKWVVFGIGTDGERSETNNQLTLFDS